MEILNLMSKNFRNKLSFFFTKLVIFSGCLDVNKTPTDSRKHAAHICIFSVTGSNCNLEIRIRHKIMSSESFTRVKMG